MAGVFGDEINNRADFFKELAHAKELVRRILKRLPDETPLTGVVRQLDAIENWTANGRTPTRKERKSLDMGYRMHRAYEMTDDVEIYELGQAVGGLNHFFELWPTDEAASNPDNEYLYDDDD